MWLAYLVAFLALLVATHVDLRIREVPDWISYGTISAGIIIALITTIVTIDYWPLVHSLAGLCIGFLIGIVMYYAGQWGGGDAKLMMGLGALIGFSLENAFLLNFIFYLIIAGGVYGLGYGVYLAILRRKQFKKAYAERAYLPRIKAIRWFFIFLVFTSFLASFFFIDDLFLKVFVVIFAAAIYLMFYAWLFAKALEEGCMKRMIPVSKLVEGDWVLEDVKIGKKKIIAARYGITLEQIEEIKKAKVKKVLVKEGIPFVPSFLLAFVCTYWFLVAQSVDMLAFIFR